MKTNYSALVIFSTIYLAVIWRYQTYPKYILLATAVFALAYFLWGIIHHLQAHNFHARIVLEYFLIALLGVAIVSTLLV